MLGIPFDTILWRRRRHNDIPLIARLGDIARLWNWVFRFLRECCSHTEYDRKQRASHESGCR